MRGGGQGDGGSQPDLCFPVVLGQKPPTPAHLDPLPMAKRPEPGGRAAGGEAAQLSSPVTLGAGRVMPSVPRPKSPLTELNAAPTSLSPPTTSARVFGDRVAGRGAGAGAAGRTPRG